MTYATIRAAAEHIARAGTITPQQLAAFSGLDEGLTTAQKQAFTELWRAEGSPIAAPPPIWLVPAAAIVAEFEGCRLDAYLCPAGVPTIGYGHTGLGVKLGQTITQQQADNLLAQDLQRFADGIHQLLPGSQHWGSNQQAALISWAFNVGLGAVEQSTLRKRLVAKEPGIIVIPQELPKWNKAGGKVLPGLARRRAAEVALFTNGLPVLQQQPAKLSPNSPFTARLTPHITLGEFALGQEARRFDYQHQVDTAAELASCMERCRARFGGKPVIITSGYRPAAINRSVGGASGSEHLYSAPGVGAVDFYIQGESVKAVQDWCDREWPYSLGYGAPKGFVHLGIRSGRPRVRWDY
jgi:GH24 family phage-related lysozyme (muramidase)